MVAGRVLTMGSLSENWWSRSGSGRTVKSLYESVNTLHTHFFPFSQFSYASDAPDAPQSSPTSPTLYPGPMHLESAQ